MTKKLPFAPLQADIDDARLESLAREKGVGTYDLQPRSVPTPELAAAETGQPAAPRKNAKVAPAGIGEEGPTSTPREKMKKLNLELPGYAWTELKIRAAQQQVSMRHIVMLALVADGISITAQDLIEDGRRLR
jgi:hypothetical protein